MSSSDRRMFLRLAGGILGGTALAACGFTPAYGPKGGAKRLMNAVATEAPTTRDDFYFIRHVSDRFGPVNTARYRLDYTISTDSLGEVVTPTNATTRYSLTGNCDYILRDANSNAVLLAGRVAGFTSWSASGTVVASDAAEEDAHRRLMVILADELATRLIAQAGTLPE